MYGKQNLQEQKILSVCFEVNRINFFNLSFGIVIVNVPKNNQCFDEMAKNTVKLCHLLTILCLESFVEIGVRDIENELFF